MFAAMSVKSIQIGFLLLIVVTSNEGYPARRRVLRSIFDYCPFGCFGTFGDYMGFGGFVLPTLPTEISYLPYSGLGNLENYARYLSQYYSALGRGYYSGYRRGYYGDNGRILYSNAGAAGLASTNLAVVPGGKPQTTVQTERSKDGLSYMTKEVQTIPQTNTLIQTVSGVQRSPDGTAYSDFQSKTITSGNVDPYGNNNGGIKITDISSSSNSGGGPMPVGVPPPPALLAAMPGALAAAAAAAGPPQSLDSTNGVGKNNGGISITNVGRTVVN
ncbi:hypothetical protein AB6A40_008083 [Gnathostoma spinigerum]|uniref:Uncharacterized protein n=1 Tax=Gnathostoma spinigerum TaxID=75299 RepID=A0ABD6EN17_9BILA